MPRSRVELDAVHDLTIDGDLSFLDFQDEGALIISGERRPFYARAEDSQIDNIDTRRRQRRGDRLSKLEPLKLPPLFGVRHAAHCSRAGLEEQRLRPLPYNRRRKITLAIPTASLLVNMSCAHHHTADRGDGIMRLYLARHGQTEWNVIRRLQGQTETELNASGFEQAKLLRARMEGVELDRVYSSGLKRSRATAEIAAAGRPVINDELYLIEIAEPKAPQLWKLIPHDKLDEL